jgi:hypothetical protein
MLLRTMVIFWEPINWLIKKKLWTALRTTSFFIAFSNNCPILEKTGLGF